MSTSGMAELPAPLRRVVKALRWMLDMSAGRGWKGPGRSPARWVVALSPVVEAALFLWIAAAVSIPWPPAVALSLAVAGVLAAALYKGPDASRGRWPWPVAVGLGVAMTLNMLLAAFLLLLLFLTLAQEALGGKGILPFMLVPLILLFAIYLDVGLVLFLTLALLMILAAGVLMDAGPVAFLAVPLVLSVGVAVILFRAISPGGGAGIKRLP